MRCHTCACLLTGQRRFVAYMFLNYFTKLFLNLVFQLFLLKCPQRVNPHSEIPMSSAEKRHTSFFTSKVQSYPYNLFKVGSQANYCYAKIKWWNLLHRSPRFHFPKVKKRTQEELFFYFTIHFILFVHLKKHTQKTTRQNRKKKIKTLSKW